MKTDREALMPWKLRIQCLRQKPADLVAGLHFLFCSYDSVPRYCWSFPLCPNQCTSRQRLKPMRARCNMTQTLFADTPKSLQISSVERPSISRNLNACTILSGNFDMQFLRTA